ncbi:hypothetical protein ACJX0J_016715, partial [Zea mays]
MVTFTLYTSLLTCSSIHAIFHVFTMFLSMLYILFIFNYYFIGSFIISFLVPFGLRNHEAHGLCFIVGLYEGGTQAHSATMLYAACPGSMTHHVESTMFRIFL